jgi:predicted ATPase
MLLAYPDAVIYRVDGRSVGAVRYEDTEHSRVAREFLANPARMLRALLEPAAGNGGNEPPSPAAP